MPKNHCDNFEKCDNITIRRNPRMDKYVCNDCKNLDKYTLIYKTLVKKQYHFNPEDHDLIKYHSTMYHNITTLYVLEDVLTVFCELHGLDMTNEDAITNKQSELQQLKNNKKRIVRSREEMCDARREQLVTALQRFNLELRDDSELCRGYINGFIKDCTVDEIIERMCEMKYLYEYCHIKNYMNKAAAMNDRELIAGYIPDCSVFQLAEDMALKKHGGYPKTWPWL